MTNEEWAALSKKPGMILYGRKDGHWYRCTLETAFDDDFKHGATLRKVSDSDSAPDRGYYPCQLIATEDDARSMRDGKPKKKKKYREKKCPVCGRMFTPHSHMQKLCSPECRKKRNSDAKHKYRCGTILPGSHTFLPRTCVVCGKTFQPRCGNQKTCGPECAEILHRETTLERQKHKDERKILQKVCPVCGTPFETYNPKRVTCSKACAEAYREKHRQEYNRRYQRGYQQRKKEESL